MYDYTSFHLFALKRGYHHLDQVFPLSAGYHSCPCNCLPPTHLMTIADGLWRVMYQLLSKRKDARLVKN